MKPVDYEVVATRIASAETEFDRAVATTLLALYYRSKGVTPVRESPAFPADAKTASQREDRRRE